MGETDLGMDCLWEKGSTLPWVILCCFHWFILGTIWELLLLGCFYINLGCWVLDFLGAFSAAFLYLYEYTKLLCPIK
jgi:hypothetical protein